MMIRAALVLVVLSSGCSDRDGATPYLGDCDTAFEYTVVDGGVTTRTTEYFAEFPIGENPRDWETVDVLLCDLTSYPITGEDCPEGATCTGEQPPDPVCIWSEDVRFPDLGVLHAWCGTVVNVDGFSSGERWDEVNLYVTEK